MIFQGMKTTYKHKMGSRRTPHERNECMLSHPQGREASTPFLADNLMATADRHA